MVGGMAEVFRAQEPRPAGEPRIVVLKRMLPSIAAEPGAREMFAEEGQIGGLLRHPNVVEVVGYGEERGQPYLVLEFVPGVDLWRLSRWLMREGRTLGEQLALFVTTELLAGLSAVHGARDQDGRALGIVHRDVSPSNVLVSVHGEVKLGDFGIAQAQLRELIPMAPVGGRAKGKLGYLAPEQVSGRECDRRADVFAAGVVTAELLMGRPLFTGSSELAVLLAVREAQIHPFIEHASSLTAGLGDAVVGALGSDPSERYATAEAFRSRLQPFITTPVAALREELAELVSGMLMSDTPIASSAPPAGTALAGVARATSGPQGQRETTPDAGSGLELDGDSLPITSDIPQIEYRVRTTVGEESGPWPYATLVEAVATGRLGPHDVVSEAGGPFRAIGEITALSRHLPPSSLTPTTRRTKTPEDPDEVVDLEKGGIARALGRSVVLGYTGLWLCTLGGIRKEVYIKNGIPEFVSSNLASELLGEHLVARGVINRGELDMALAIMPRFEGRLGDTLTALGLVDPIGLLQHIAGQVREKLFDLFCWSGGRASFYEGVPPPASGFRLGLDPWRVIEEGLRRRFGQGMEDDQFADNRDRDLVQRPDVPREVIRAALPSDVRLVMSTLGDPMTFDQLLARLPGEGSEKELHVRLAVVLLMHLDAVAWA